MKLEDMTEPQLANTMRMAVTAAVAGLEIYGVEPAVPGGKHKIVLLVFDDPKVAQYAATCRREDVIVALREAADRLEKNLDVTRGT
jgi:hypothetical protein